MACFTPLVWVRGKIAHDVHMTWLAMADCNRRKHFVAYNVIQTATLTSMFKHQAAQLTSFAATFIRDTSADQLFVCHLFVCVHSLMMSLCSVFTPPIYRVLPPDRPAANPGMFHLDFLWARFLFLLQSLAAQTKGPECGLLIARWLLVLLLLFFS